VLGRASHAEPPNVRLVAADLEQAGIDGLNLPDQATWSSVDVTIHLERSVTEATLHAIASKHPRTTLVANFLPGAKALDLPCEAVRTASTMAVAAAGEPFLASYRGQVPQLLSEAGFSDVDLLDADAPAPGICGTDRPTPSKLDRNRHRRRSDACAPTDHTSACGHWRSKR
jgi:hypothetical protein